MPLEQLEALEHPVYVATQAELALLVNLVQPAVQAGQDLLEREEIQVLQEIQDCLEQ